MSSCTFCIHGHFYQPPRADPFTGRVPEEPDAAPYANWNERITAECYAPMAEAGHLEQISFNLGGTLARWLDQNAHTTYERIVASERAYRDTHGVGNGLSQAAHHTILPLARRRDKICQVRWGAAGFQHRFGHRAAGMWLPEMAVDVQTLEILALEGVRFVILSDEQVEGELEAGAGPYRVRLPGGADIVVFVRDRDLSNALSFTMPSPAESGDWLRAQIDDRCRDGHLLLIATDGETFGHHNRLGVQALGEMLTAAKSHQVPLATLPLYLRDHPPHHEVRIVENTSWSCAHGLARWATGCPCTAGDSRWKGAVRRALDNLACDLDQVFVHETRRAGSAPWPLRDGYISVLLGQMDGPALLAEHDLHSLGDDRAERLLWLLEAQFYRQRMYASCTFFFDDLDRHEPRYAIANAARALQLTHRATGDDLTTGFRRDLRMAVSARTARTGADILGGLLALQTN